MRASDRFPWATAKPLEKLLSDQWNNEVNKLIDDALSMSMGQAIEALVKCTNYYQITNVHDRWVDRTAGDINKLKLDYDKAGLSKPFPDAPLPAGEGIEPVVNLEDLLAEAKAMHHCVASYARRIQRGQYYVYHVSPPMHPIEHLTLGLFVDDTHLAFDQLQGYKNLAPSSTAYMYVSDWLTKHGVSGFDCRERGWHRMPEMAEAN
jgi:hypothetical protein